jgi:hypothetical protein
VFDDETRLGAPPRFGAAALGLGRWWYIVETFVSRKRLACNRVIVAT